MQEGLVHGPVLKYFPLRISLLTSDVNRATEHRITHTMGDYIEYRDDNNDTHIIAHLDYLFVHEYFNEYRLFAIVTQAIPSSRHDSILGLPFMHMSNGGFAGNDKNKFGTKIVGLPVITASRPYLIPVIEGIDRIDLDQDVIYAKRHDKGKVDKALLYCNAWEAVSL